MKKIVLGNIQQTVSEWNKKNTQTINELSFMQTE